MSKYKTLFSETLRASADAWLNDVERFQQFRLQNPSWKSVIIVSWVLLLIDLVPNLFLQSLTKEYLVDGLEFSNYFYVLMILQALIYPFLLFLLAYYFKACFYLNGVSLKPDFLVWSIIVSSIPVFIAHIIYNVIMSILAIALQEKIVGFISVVTIFVILPLYIFATVVLTRIIRWENQEIAPYKFVLSMLTALVFVPILLMGLL